MSLKKILVNITNPDHPSDALLAKLRLMAAAQPLHVELFHCCYSRSLHNSYLFDKEAEKHAIAGYQQQAETKLIALAEQLQQDNIIVGYDVSWNRHSAEGLIRKALRYQADLVISLLGRHSLGHYLLRQGDWKLIAECPIPLLMLKEQPWSNHPRVLASVDPFSGEHEQPAELDQHILATATELAQGLGGELHVGHFFSVLPQAAIFDEHLTTDYAGLKEKVREQHLQALSAFIQQQPMENPLIHLVEGEVHKALPALVQEQALDVVVMGSVARGLLDRLLVGSTVERVLDEIPCDVLLVKAPGFVSPVSEA